MANEHGDFVWYELMTTDADAAQRFYSGLLGWTFEDSSTEDVQYRTFSGPKGQVGGMLQLTEEMTNGGARPVWLGYVGVDDVEAAAKSFERAGGSITFTTEVPDVGPIALVSDPQGAMLYLVEDRSGKQSHAFATHEPTPGHCAWNELLVDDPAKARDFYGKQFGWVVADTMDMGEMGGYDMMKNGEGRDFMFGGLMKRPAEMPVSAWGYYFRVPDIDAAQRYVTEHGGTLFGEPMPVPGDDFCLNGTDPQGAVFAVVGKRCA